MFEIKVKTTFSAAHNLKNYRGKCERLHGHNWVVEAVFQYTHLDKEGLAVDFKIAKEILIESIEPLDHAYLNDLEPLKKINPTSENIAKFIYDSVKARNKDLSAVSVWENDTSCATYTEG